MAGISLVNELPLAEQDNKRCLFCNRKDDNELLLGKFFSDGVNFTAHYYCLLFASGLEQKGDVDEGILGFVMGDIEKEVKRGKKLKCFKCHRTGATVGCCNKKCNRNYHFPCGFEARMLNQYFGAFESFCINHHPVQKVPTLRGSMAVCTICFEDVMIDKLSYQVLWAPCCKKRAWFHRDCIQKLALSAGYFFACPMCSDDGLFVNEMKDMGIYVPNQDASWELEPNAFQELEQRNNKCDHENCRCPEGRTRDDDNDAGSLWNLMLCITCGSKCLHIGCGNLEEDIIEWECDDCSLIPGESSSNHSRGGQLTNGFGPHSTTISIQANSSSTLKRPHPDKEGQRNSSSSCSNDDDSEVEIIAIIPAPGSSTCAQSLRYYSKPSYITDCANSSQCKMREMPVKIEPPELSGTSEESRVATNTPIHSFETPTNASTEFINCSTEELTSNEAADNTPLISCTTDSSMGVHSSEPLNRAEDLVVRNLVNERTVCVPSVANNGSLDMIVNNQPNIKVENVNTSLFNEAGSTDVAVDPLQERQMPATNVSNKEQKQAPPKNPTLQVVEVTKLSYQGLTIRIFSNVISEENNRSRRFFFEPIVLLDPKSVIQQLFQQNVVRFSIQMWNAEIRSKVLDHLRLKNFKLDEDNVSVMPYEVVQFVGEPERMHRSIKILEEATSYHRQNEQLAFFLLCDSSSTAQFIGDQLRHCPEFVVQRCKLALECRGLAMNLSMINDKESDIVRPFFKFFVSTVPILEPPQTLVLANHNQCMDISNEVATVSQVFPDIGSGGCMTIPISSRSGTLPNEPAFPLSPQLQPLHFSHSQRGSPCSLILSTGSIADASDEKQQRKSMKRGQQPKKQRTPTSSSSNKFNNPKRPREQTYSQVSVTESRTPLATPYLSTGLPPRPSLPVSLPLWLPDGTSAAWTPHQRNYNFASPLAAMTTPASGVAGEEDALARERQEKLVRERERDRRKIEDKEMGQQRERERIDKHRTAPANFEREKQAAEKQTAKQHDQLHELLLRPRLRPQMEREQKDTEASSRILPPCSSGSPFKAGSSHPSQQSLIMSVIQQSCGSRDQRDKDNRERPMSAYQWTGYRDCDSSIRNLESPILRDGRQPPPPPPRMTLSERNLYTGTTRSSTDFINFSYQTASNPNLGQCSSTQSP